jgi:acyl carrier protein
VNELGSTEAEVSRRYFADHDTEIEEALVPVGYPIEDKEVLVLGDDGAAAAVDVVGEIAIRSRYLCLGYWQEPELTAAAFRPDPSDEEKLIHRTGDLGRMRSDGCLVHVGRKDAQVKVRGYRVDVAEVEAALLDLPAVKDAVVVARHAPDGDPRLVAYLVASSPAAPVTTLRRHLAGTLPAYMLPAAFVWLDALPQTPNGKVDRLALPDSGEGRRELAGYTFVTPRTPRERELAMIWERILDVRPVGVTDDFFELGGDSLAAVSLFLEIEKTYGTDLPLATLFQAPTIERMVPLLERDGSSGLRPSLVAIQPAGVKPPFFCVHPMGGQVLSFEASPGTWVRNNHSMGCRRGGWTAEHRR